MQYEMFNNNNFYKLGEHTKVCKYCEKELPLEFFMVRYKGYAPEGKKGRNHICNDCFKRSSKLIKELKEKAPPKPEDNSCDCCGNQVEVFHLDHCHKTKKFRGWLCRSCNIGLGFLNDDIDTLEKGLKYLKGTE